MMALLDDKLLQQEQKNSFKERLMFKSLEVVRGEIFLKFFFKYRLEI